MPANNFSSNVQPSRLIGTSPGVTNGTATATAAAPGVGFKWVVTGVDWSSSGTIAAGVAPTLTRTFEGATETATYGIPPAQIAPCGREFSGPGLDCDENTAASSALPALGAGVTGFVNLYGRKVAVR